MVVVIYVRSGCIEYGEIYICVIAVVFTSFCNDKTLLTSGTMREKISLHLLTLYVKINS